LHLEIAVELEPTQKSSLDLPSLEGEDAVTLADRLRNFPWWFVAIILFLALTYLQVYLSENYRQAFGLIIFGLSTTITISVLAYIVALIVGLVAGMGRISRNTIARNVATFYVEFIRGVPMLVLIFYIAFVLVPSTLGAIQQLGLRIEDIGLESIGQIFTAADPQGFSFYWRATIALAITYGAFLAEIFRAGIESIEKGQMEAARSLGMSYGQAMRQVILPQAIRNVLPALGNDFIAMVKESSLVSVLAVRDITQIARLYAGRSFRFQESYSILTVLYLTLTIVLSLILRGIERRLNRDAR
jgi:polar amino acid transport system permease protein